MDAPALWPNPTPPPAPIGVASSAAAAAMQTADEQLTQAYLAHRDALQRWLTVRLRDPDLAEELTQEAFIRLMTTLRAGIALDNTRAWLFQVAANLLVSHVRHVRVAMRHAGEPVAGHLETGAAPSTEAIVVAQERMDHVGRAIVRLSPQDQRLLLLAGMGEDGPCLAARAGVSSVAIRARLCRARRRLRDQVGIEEGSGALPAA